mgnify:CR=1 FL=1
MSQYSDPCTRLYDKTDSLYFKTGVMLGKIMKTIKTNKQLYQNRRYRVIQLYDLYIDFVIFFLI